MSHLEVSGLESPSANGVYEFALEFPLSIRTMNIIPCGWLSLYLRFADGIGYFLVSSRGYKSGADRPILFLAKADNVSNIDEGIKRSRVDIALAVQISTSTSFLQLLTSPVIQNGLFFGLCDDVLAWDIPDFLNSPAFVQLLPLSPLVIKSGLLLILYLLYSIYSPQFVPRFNLYLWHIEASVS
jgi:hypothetical protein